MPVGFQAPVTAKMLSAAISAPAIRAAFRWIRCTTTVMATSAAVVLQIAVGTVLDTVPDQLPREEQSADSSPAGVMPAAFFGHGNPMNPGAESLHRAPGGRSVQAVPRPGALLVVSAHWYINATAVTAMRGRGLFTTSTASRRSCSTSSTRRRACRGSTTRSAARWQPTWVGADVDSWGSTTGPGRSWCMCSRDASIPVVQLSINADKLDYHLELGRTRAARLSGVLVIASGNVVHNLRADGLVAHRRCSTGRSGSTRTPRPGCCPIRPRLPGWTRTAITGPPFPPQIISSRFSYLAGLAGTATRAWRGSSWTATPTAHCR